MKKLHKLFWVILLTLLFPFYSFAQTEDNVSYSNYSEENFRAKIVEVLDEQTTTGQSGEQITLQNLKLLAIDGSMEGEELIFDGIGKMTTTSQIYHKGDKVLVLAQTQDGQIEIQPIDVWRVNPLIYLALFFLVVVAVIGRWRGLRALLSLVITFIIIFFITIPLIARGMNPILITSVSAMIIIITSMPAIYGWNMKSQAAIISITISIIIAVLLSYLFVKACRLTGFSEEEAVFLTDTFKNHQVFPGLLLAAFSLGALGILDDVVLTQISSVEQIKRTNPHLHPVEVYRRSMRIGVDHITSMINTLFLAYAGSAFFLLFLIKSKEPPFNNFFETINNEVVATEIVRTLVGSVGLILAIPIATYIASFYFFKYSSKN